MSKIVWLSCMVLLIAACTPSEEALPTLVPTAAEDVAPQEEASPTDEIPPTDTATPFVRPTLPPTWTPVPTEEPASPTPEPVVIPPTPTLFIPSSSGLSPECDTFDVDFLGSTTEFVLGESPVVKWIAIPSARLYRVTINRADGVVVKDDIYLDEPTYAFPAEFFESGQFYGWTVYPIDEAGIQMCPSRGAELILIRPLGG